MKVLIGKDAEPTGSTVKLLFEPRDLWLGVFFNTAQVRTDEFILVYVCLIPCFPVVLVLKRK